MTFNQLKSL